MLITAEKFDTIKRFYNTKSKLELCDLLSISKRTLDRAIEKIQKNPNASYYTLYKQAGRKEKNKENLRSEI